jgi:hypothetical protein
MSDTRLHDTNDSLPVSTTLPIQPSVTRSEFATAEYLIRLGLLISGEHLVDLAGVDEQRRFGIGSVFLSDTKKLSIELPQVSSILPGGQRSLAAKDG